MITPNTLRALGLLFISLQSLVFSNPVVTQIKPAGLQRGQTAELTFQGARLDKAKDILFQTKGIEQAGPPTTINAKEVKIPIKVLPDAPLGEHLLRLRCDDGISYQKIFRVGPYPQTVLSSSVKNYSLETAYHVKKFPFTIQGQLQKEGVNYYALILEQEQSISVEIEAMRLGRTMFDPHLSLLSPDQKVLLEADDSLFLGQDCSLQYKAKHTGIHYIAVRDSTYSGGNLFQYRLHLGDFPRPSLLKPLAILPNTSSELTLLGDHTGKLQETISPKGEGLYPVFTSKNGTTSPTPNYVRVSSLATFEENSSEGNNPKNPPSLPAAFHGVIDQAKQVDKWTFLANKGQTYRATIYARRLGSPLDSIIVARNSDNKGLANNDDTREIGVDSQIEFELKETGTVRINVSDTLGQYGKNFLYRLEVTPVTDHANLTSDLVQLDRRDDQKHRAIEIPRGSYTAYKATVKRTKSNTNLAYSAKSLPTGATFSEVTVPKGQNDLLIHLGASPDAPLAAENHLIEVHSKEDKISGSLSDAIDMTLINNVGIFYKTNTPEIPITIIEAPAYTINLQQPSTPIAKNGNYSLQIELDRKEGYPHDIKVTIPWLPAGLTTQNSITIKKGQTKGTFQLSSKAEAKSGDYQICVRAEHGDNLVASNLVTVSIIDSYLSGTLTRGSSIQGKATELLCHLEHVKKFDGEGEIRLIGLSDPMKTKPASIRSGQEKVHFPIEVPLHTRQGNHNNLYAIAKIPVDTGYIEQKLAFGGQLRIDPQTKEKKKDISLPK